MQAVRVLVNAQHTVCFGFGDGHNHLIITTLTGEVNRMRDHGFNCLQDLIIVPPEQVDNVANEFAVIQQDVIGFETGVSNEADFHWQGS